MSFKDFINKTASITIDVEWAHPEVLQDVLSLLDEREIRATLFCTHPEIQAGSHERGLHPNFRRNGDVGKAILHDLADTSLAGNESEYLKQVLQRTLAFAPEAVGSRSHSLYYDSQLMPIYRDLGLKYDSTYFMPLCSGLQPFLKEYGVIELPIYYNDFFELRTSAVDMDARSIRLESPGMKIFNFHPNLIYTNCPSLTFYEGHRRIYSNPEELRKARFTGRGSRDLFVNLLDRLVKMNIPVLPLAEIEKVTRPELSFSKFTQDVDFRETQITIDN